MFRVIIAGGRDFQDYALLQRTVDVFLEDIDDDISIVSGKAKGADSLGERYANERGYTVRAYPADWQQHGKAAGFIRNREMAQNADALIAFWNGQSRGTEHMIKTAHQHSLMVHVVICSDPVDQDPYVGHLKAEDTE